MLMFNKSSETFIIFAVLLRYIGERLNPYLSNLCFRINFGPTRASFLYIDIFSFLFQIPDNAKVGDSQAL